MTFLKLHLKWKSSHTLRNKKMQLDVEVSPPVNTVTFSLGVTHVTLDSDPKFIGS